MAHVSVTDGIGQTRVLLNIILFVL